ncbi:hypothetical protein LP7551_02049 [Roseibium album]|nr:hypothetical protein LP7551_02049 [Roseibium album]
MRKLLLLLLVAGCIFSFAKNVRAESCLGGVSSEYVLVEVTYHSSGMTGVIIELCFTNAFWYSKAGEESLAQIILGMSAGKLSSADVYAELFDFMGGVRKNHTHDYGNVTVTIKALKDPLKGSKTGILPQ